MKIWLPILCFWLMVSACENKADKHYQEAYDNYLDKKYDIALSHINIAVEEGYSPYAYSLKSSIHARLGQCADAVQASQMALFIHLKEESIVDPFLFEAFGEVWERCERPDSALRYYNSAMAFARTDSEKTSVFISRSFTKTSLGDFEGAYEDAQSAIGLQPQNPITYAALADVCEIQGNIQEGIYYLEKALEVDPTYELAYTNLGFFHQRIGEYAISNSYINKAIERDYLNAAYSYNNRAYNKLQLGDLEGAMQDVNTSLELDSKNSYAYRNRALIWLAMDEKEKACEDIEHALQLGFTSRYSDEVEKLKDEHCE